jgi:hypothetical protein
MHQRGRLLAILEYGGRLYLRQLWEGNSIVGDRMNSALSDRSVLKVAEIEKEQLKAYRRHAARFIASQATDAVDCAELLDMLGIEASEGK